MDLRRSRARGADVPRFKRIRVRSPSIAGSKTSPISAGRSNEGDAFVSGNYAALKERRVFSAAIPEELGGGGASHREVCDMLRTLAQYCGSTALALSMHQHLIAATVWKYRRGQGGEAMLTMVAENQLVLVSTGAGDWLESNGSTTKIAGGYLVSAPTSTLPASPR